MQIKVSNSQGSSEIITLPKKYIEFMNTIKNLCQDCIDLPENEPLDLTDETKLVAESLKYIIEYIDSNFDELYAIYCPNPANSANVKQIDICHDLNEFDMAFFGMKSQKELFSLMIACDYLDFKYLLNKLCKNEADIIKGKNAQELRERYGLINDFTDEEIAEIEKETSWINEN